jgi:hypothetical protein
MRTPARQLHVMPLLLARLRFPAIYGGVLTFACSRA